MPRSGQEAGAGPASRRPGRRRRARLGRRRRPGRSAGPSPPPGPRSGDGLTGAAPSPARSVEQLRAPAAYSDSAWSSGSCCHRSTTRWSSCETSCGTGDPSAGASASVAHPAPAGAGSRGRARPGVTMRPWASSQEYFSGAPAATARSIESKSTASEYDARPTAKSEMTMPSAPLPPKPQPLPTP